jgi:hypothetical protein
MWKTGLDWGIGVYRESNIYPSCLLISHDEERKV